MLLLGREDSLKDEQFCGGSALTAHSDMFLTTTEVFGAGVDNGAVLLTRPSEDGTPLSRGLWLMSDVRAENSSHDTSQINRMAYQANVVLDQPPLSSTSDVEVAMHNTDFIFDASAARDDQVASPSVLNIGILEGTQTFPAQSTDEKANRLLIFTGSIICLLGADGDGELTRGVVRVRLHFEMPDTIHFIGSATVAALADVHGNDDNDVLFAVDTAKTIVGPSDEGTIPDPTVGPPLPVDELYVIIDAATMGPKSVLNRIAYQANVLVRDTAPDLESILVRPSGSGNAFSHEASVSAGAWDYLITFTGPIVTQTALVAVSTSDPAHVPVGAGTLAGTTFVQLAKTQTSGAFQAPNTSGDSFPVEATITAAYTRQDGGVTTKTAKVLLPANPK
jgi:hypothetical protein